jgi:hypothetical protein
MLLLQRALNKYLSLEIALASDQNPPDPTQYRVWSNISKPARRALNTAVNWLGEVATALAR